MKEIKTANYNKKFGRGVETHEVEGEIETIDKGKIYVGIIFKYSPSVNSRDYLEPSSSSSWEIIKVTDETGRILSDREIDLYQEQIDNIIYDWELNTDMREGPDSDWDFDSYRDEQLFND